MSPKRKAIAHNPLTMRLHPRDTHANPLFRTRAISSARGPAIPSLGHLIRTWTRYSEPGPSHPHVNPLFRTRAISSARGPAIPSLGDPAHMRNSGLTCGTEGLRAGQRAQPYTRPTTSHANPLFQAWASSSACGPAIPSLGDPAHMQNSGLTCGTAGLRAGRVGVQVVVARG